MPRPKSPARLTVESLEDRVVPAFGLDTTFGVNGTATDPVGPVRFVSVADAAAGPNNTIITAGMLAGPDLYGAGGDVAVVRTTAAGKADTTFGGGDGLVTFSFPPNRSLQAIAVQSNGGILIAGSAPASGQNDLYVLRLNADGTRDTTFGVGGEAVIDFGASDFFGGITVQADGKIVLAGSTYVSDTSQAAVARLTASGMLDSTFGTGGKAVGAAGATGWVGVGVAVRPDGKIVLGGTSGRMGWPEVEYTVVQYAANGTLDSSFGTGGVAKTHYEFLYYGYASDLALLGDGRVVVGGGSSYGQGLLAWFGPSGDLVAQEQFDGLADGLSWVDEVVPLPGGGVRAVGRSYTGHGGTVVEAHPAPGVTGGRVTVNPPGGNPGWQQAVLGTDGKLSLVGVVAWNTFIDPLTIGGPLTITRFADPGTVSSPITSVRWLSSTMPTPGPVTLAATVVPLLGESLVQAGTITFKEGQTVLGTIDLAANAGRPPLEQVHSVWVNLTSGAHTVTAEYSGAPGWSSSKATQTILVDYEAEVLVQLQVAEPDPALGGAWVLQAQLLRADNGAPPDAGGGTVTFYSGDTPLGTGTLFAGGHAYLYLEPGTYPTGTQTIRAVYSGAPGFKPAESESVTVTVPAPAKAATTTDLGVTGSAVVGLTATLTATVRGQGRAAPGGSVTFYDGSTVLGTATVGANGVATLTTTLRLGQRTFKATYSGDANNLASASNSWPYTVSRAMTATTLTASTASVPVGQPVTFTAQVRVTTGVAFPVGTVEFREGTKILGRAALDGRGVAKLTLTNLAAGSHAVSAWYLGCSTCEGGASAARSVTVGSAAPVATTTALTTSVTAPVFGQSQTLRAKVTGAGGRTATGRVDFYDGATFLGSATLSNGLASLPVRLNLGAHKLRAVFVGNASFAASSSAVLYQTVGKAPTTVQLSLASDGVALRAKVTPAFAGAPIGTVTFRAGGIVLGTAAVNGNGIAVFKLAQPPGLTAITAVYSGSSCFLGSTSDPLATGVAV
jgi:uncharacterized delta-60 repeat protein